VQMNTKTRKYLFLGYFHRLGVPLSLTEMHHNKKTISAIELTGKFDYKVYSFDSHFTKIRSSTQVKASKYITGKVHKGKCDCF